MSQPPPGRPGRHPGHPRGGISRGHFPDVRRRQGHRFNVREDLAGVVGDFQSRRSLSRTRSLLLQRGILRGHFREKQKRRGASGARSPRGRLWLALAAPERCSTGYSSRTSGEPPIFPGKFIRRGVGVVGPWNEGRGLKGVVGAYGPLQPLVIAHQRCGAARQTCHSLRQHNSVTAECTQRGHSVISLRTLQWRLFAHWHGQMCDMCRWLTLRNCACVFSTHTSLPALNAASADISPFLSHFFHKKNAPGDNCPV